MGLSACRYIALRAHQFNGQSADAQAVRLEPKYTATNVASSAGCV